MPLRNALPAPTDAIVSAFVGLVVSYIHEAVAAELSVFVRLSIVWTVAV